MATATAHFDLTKAGSNENYNVGLVNSNLDKIDQQMYLNQTSAAKVMVGATSDADGESGRVPQPNAGDEDKYLKANGTWDTPSGGGGGSSTLVGLTDVDISSPTNGQVLKYNSTTQKWENADEGGSSQRTYLGQLIPRVSASDYKITASTSNSSFADWGAFNGVSPSDLRNPSSNSCWLAEPNLTNQYIQYRFDAPRYFTKIEIVCFSNYSSDWVGDIKVEGSTDGSTWTNILASGTTYELTAGFQTMTTVEINLDDTDLWEYIRLTFVDEMSVYYQPSCFIDEIYVYGGEEISGGGTDVIELTQSEYNALPDEEKNNGCIYMVSSQASTPEELTEAQTNTSTAVTASSYNYDANLNQYHYPWCAFNRVSPNPNEMAYPTPGVTTQTCWTPNVSQDGSNSWICYHFDRAYKMTSMTINSFTDYSSSATKSMVIEGSNDGTNWTNILLTGNSFSLNSNLHTLTPNNVNLNSDTAYEYVRLRSLEPMGESYQPSVFIDEIFVYGYKSEKSLKKIYYMGTEYGNTGGGGGTLRGTALISSQITTAGTYTLNDGIENYDLISIVSGASNAADIRTLIVADVLNMLSNNLIVNLPGTNGRWVNITALSGTSITVAMDAPIIHSITGYTWS